MVLLLSSIYPTDSVIERGRQSLSPDSAPHKRNKLEVLCGLESTSAAHHPSWTRIPLSDKQKQNLLVSLKFEQIDARQMTIKPAHAKTCKWLLDCEQYLGWLEKSRLGEHHGLLWIKGKAGTGKSTLMKFALSNARLNMRNFVGLSFFFNARGEEIERSTTGTFRSLLLQLLERIPALQNIFDSSDLPMLDSSASKQWPLESLKALLEKAIRNLGESSVVCFIDALDECKEEQVRDMIQFFEHIGDLAVSNGICFQVCLSSRHYPHITIRNGLELILERQEGHSQDIVKYIKTELNIGRSKLEEQVQAELHKKASGIFMWVVLVVGILNKESDCGRVNTLREKLQEIPGDLDELFRDILTRDSNDKNELVLCIQWILFAKQPLSPEQLYYAIIGGTSPQLVARWDPEDMTSDILRRFILNSSKGLAEITTSREPKVQFIHESVRDFLIKENGLGKVWPELESNFQGRSHERLKQCCLNYFSADTYILPKTLNDLAKRPVPDLEELRESVGRDLPFLEYAVCNLLYHANAAGREGVPQKDFIGNFPPPRWIRLGSMFEWRGRRGHTERVGLPHLLADLDMASLIPVSGLSDCFMDEEDGHYGCPVLTTDAIKNAKAVEMFSRSRSNELRQMNVSLAPVHGQQNLQQRSTPPFSRFPFGLVMRWRKYAFNPEDASGRDALWWASKEGCNLSARFLLVVCLARINSKDKDNVTALYFAAEEGNQAVVEALLERNADVNACGGVHGQALQAAAVHGNKEIVALLLDNGANINAQGGNYGNALQAASAWGYKEIVMLLLEKGADVNAQGGHFDTPLQAALRMGHAQIAAILHERMKSSAKVAEAYCWVTFPIVSEDTD